ncbi:MAG: hypothetical protein AAB961_01590 [Patescibacteria group bacterium]
MARNRGAHKIRSSYNPSRLDLKRLDYAQPAKAIPESSEAPTVHPTQPSFAEGIMYVLFGNEEHLVPDLEQAIQDLDRGEPVVLNIRNVMEHYAVRAPKEAKQ